MINIGFIEFDETDWKEWAMLIGVIFIILIYSGVI